MYGWIHECLKSMIISRYGETIWLEIIQKCGIEQNSWEIQEYIPDYNFYLLTTTASQIIGIHEYLICEMYGNYFLQYVNDKGYDKLLRCLGNNLYEWLSNVNQVHQHLLYVMTHMKPPNIWCEKINPIDNTSFILYYQSIRGARLIPIMVGIVTAVAKRYFGKIIALELLSTQDIDGSDATSWKVTEIDDISDSNYDSDQTITDSIINDAVIELESTTFEEDAKPTSNELSASSMLKVCPASHVSNSESRNMPISVGAVLANEIFRNGQQLSPLSIEITSGSRPSNSKSPLSSNSNQRHGTSKSSTSHYGLSFTQLHRLFPCHLIFDSDYQILQVGSQIPKLLTKVTVGARLSELFDIKNHNVTWEKNWDDLAAVLTSKPQFVIQARQKTSKTHQALSLSGPISFSDDGRYAVFLCAPDISTLNELYDFNLSMSDIAIYGCRLQMVLQDDHLTHVQESNQKLTELTQQIKIEQQHRLELMEEVANKANETLAIKQTFVRYVSHEIRTPLSVAKLGLLLLEQELRESQQIDQKFQSHIKECQDSLDIAVNILNDLLCYEKLESGIFELEKQITPAVEFVEQSVQLFSIQAKQKEIDLILQNELPLEMSSSLMFDIDSKKMSQVVRNFVSNALKFTPKHGIVTVSMKYSPRLEDYDIPTLALLNSVSDKNNNLEYCLAGVVTVGFQDTGVGINKENQSKLFHEIVQFSPNSLQNGAGSGLGLWISKSIVERHHGSVGLHSDGVGHGSSFFMKVPVYASASVLQKLSLSSLSQHNDPFLVKNYTAEDCVVLGQSDEVQTPEAVREKRRRKEIFFGLKILIVDDAPLVRKLMKNILSSKGTICDCAEDGTEAVNIIRSSLNTKICQDSQYDIIFMDFMMPNMNGPEATKEIRSLGYHGLIIGVTGNMMTTDVELFIQAGANKILPKPLSLPELEDYLLQVFH